MRVVPRDRIPPLIGRDFFILEIEDFLRRNLKMDYSKTLHLPQTEFPMRGNLPKKEPEFVDFWQKNDLYEKRVEKRQHDGAPTFVLHDGPPYANGKIHIGHALNKTLKDVIVRYKYMAGDNANYIPGWDTHGLPIEYAVLKDSGEDRANMTPLELRRKCLEYAKKWIAIQKEDFIRMGVVGDFKHPYVTFDPHLEAKELEVFGEMAKKHYIYKGKKAVYWCPHCETALAEAEIEYKDRKSPSIYVKYPAVDIKGLGPDGVDPSKLFAVIWTTTPWTIPASLYISVNPKFTYVWVHNKTADEYYLMSKELAPAAMADCKIEDYEFVGREMLGSEWDLATFHHPLAIYNRTIYVLEGNHVTLDAGTGCVHTAPGHGVEDFEVYKSYENAGKLKQEVVCPVDEKGNMTAEAGEFLQGKSIWDAEGPVISALAHEGREMLGSEWDLATFHHPLAIYNRTIYVLEGNHVTLDAGTGCVHTAPGHGVEDFEVYKSYENAGKLKQEVVCPVDEKGNMTAEAGEFLQGKSIWDAEGPVISALAHEGHLLGKKSIHHQYAHCWRCKNPVI